VQVGFGVDIESGGLTPSGSFSIRMVMLVKKHPFRIFVIWIVGNKQIARIPQKDPIPVKCTVLLQNAHHVTIKPHVQPRRFGISCKFAEIILIVLKDDKVHPRPLSLRRLSSIWSINNTIIRILAPNHSFSCKCNNLLNGLDNSGFSSELEIHGDSTFIPCREL
jgi:hypothetical protein